MIETSKIGIATAKAMDQIEEFVEKGFIPEDAYVGAAYVVVALDHPTPDDKPDRENMRDVSTQVYVFGSPEEIYIQNGVVRMALQGYEAEE